MSLFKLLCSHWLALKSRNAFGTQRPLNTDFMLLSWSLCLMLSVEQQIHWMVALVNGGAK